MKWFKKKKPKPVKRKATKRVSHVTLENNVVPLSTLARWYLYDTDLEEPNKIALRMGMSSVSEEGNEKELEDSDKRIENIISLYPFIGAISDINAKSIAATQMLRLEESGHPDEIEGAESVIEELYRVIGHAAVISAFSIAIQLGIVNLNKNKDSSQIIEEYDEF